MTEAQRRHLTALIADELRTAAARALATGTTAEQLQADLAARRRRLDAMT